MISRRNVTFQGNAYKYWGQKRCLFFFLRHLKEILQSLKYASTPCHRVIAVAFVAMAQWDLLDVLSAWLSLLWVGELRVCLLYKHPFSLSTCPSRAGLPPPPALPGSGTLASLKPLLWSASAALGSATCEFLASFRDWALDPPTQRSATCYNSNTQWNHCKFKAS